MAVADLVVPPAGYPLIFRQYILRNVQLSLEQVRCSGDTLAEAVKNQALHILDFALRLDDGWPLLRELLFYLSPYMARLGDRRRWVAYLEQALQLCRRLDDQSAEAQLTWNLGVLQRQLGELAAAESHLMHSRRLATALGQERLLARTLTELAHLAQMQHRLADAKALVSQAHALLPAADNECAPGHSVLGDVLFEEEQWAQAATEIQRAIVLWEAHGQPTSAASGWRGLARVRWGQGDIASALACYQRALALYEASQEPIQHAITWIGLGGLYAGCAEPQPALACLAKAEAVLLPIQDNYHLAMLYTNYGIAHRLLQAWQPAITALHKSLAYYRILDDGARQINVLIEVATVYAQCGAADSMQQTLAQAQTILDQLPASPVAARYRTIMTQMVQEYVNGN